MHRTSGEPRTSFTERWADVSLRAKITGVTVFILSLGLIVAGIGTQSFLRPQLIAVQDTELRQMLENPKAVLVPGADPNALQCADVTQASPRFYVAVLDGEGEVLCDNLSANTTVNLHTPAMTPDTAQQNLGVAFSIQAEEGPEWRAVAGPIFSNQGGNAAGTLVIASSTAAVNQTMARFAFVFSGFGIAVLLLGAALTRILITNTFVPLAEVEQTALEISQGDFSKRIMISSPHTEVGHLGQSLNVMLDRIDDSFEERVHTIDQMRRFISDAGHELRTPLVSVRGYAEMYRHGWLTDSEQLDQAMERIEKEAIRMGGLVDDLLALARLDERRPLERTPLPLNDLAADAALDTHAQAPDREITVIDDPAAPVVTGDEDKVRQVMTNLIGNALRYSPDGSPLEIRVTSAPEHGTAAFEVIDHGEGVPEQLRTKIFDRFWRADTSRNRETGGSGLGLSIVESIGRAHGGSVTAHETPGGGATFRVELQLQPPAEPAQSGQ
jgi:two-component system OmpR family sensor kinase